MGTVVKPNTFSNGQTIDAPLFNADMDTLYSLVNENVDNANFKAAAAISPDKLAGFAAGAGVDSGSIKRRGKSVVTAEHGHASKTYATLPTPDVVTDVVLPTDGLIFILFDALVKQNPLPNLPGGPGCAIFLDDQQARARFGANMLASQFTFPSAVPANTYVPLFTTPAGLISQYNEAVAAPDPVTTGQACGAALPLGTPGASLWGIEFPGVGGVTEAGYTTIDGGPLVVHAAAGTYDVSVQFRNGGGVAPVPFIFAKQRRLWVWTVGFE